MSNLHTSFLGIFQRIKQLIKRPAVFASVVAALLGVPAIIVLAQSASTTLESGSYLGVVGQVVSPSPAANLNSTDAISSGDTVQWTNYFQSKLASPYKSTGVVTVPTNFSWVHGTIVAPASTTLRYYCTSGCAVVGWNTDDPATGATVTLVEWTTNPIEVIAASPPTQSVANFSGTGDGFRIITYKNNLYVVNHVSQSATGQAGLGYVACRVAASGAVCPGFSQSLAIPATNGTAATTSETTFETPNRSIEHLDSVTGNLYTYGAFGTGAAGPNNNRLQVQVRCLNLDTLTACMNAVSIATLTLKTQSNQSGYSNSGRLAINTIGSIDKKYYGILNDGRITCFDVSTQAICSLYNTPITPLGWSAGLNNWTGFSTTNSQGVAYAWGAANTVSTEFENTILGTKLFVSVANTIRCFDTAISLPCVGWAVGSNPHPTPTIVNLCTPPGVCNTPRLSSISPVLNPDGTPKGVCSSSFATVQCRTLANVSFTPSANYSAFLFANQFRWTGGVGGTAYQSNQYGHGNTFVIPANPTTGAIAISRVFQASGNATNTNNYASCFDFVTDAPCDYTAVGATGGRLFTASGNFPDTYSVFQDTVRSNCMWSVGDAAIATSFNPITGGPCPSVSAIPPLIKLDVSPSASFSCDGSKSRVNGWGKIRFSDSLTWGGQGLTAMSAKIMDVNGTVLPSTLSPARNYANRPFVYGEFTLDISEIPYSTYPRLKIELSTVAGAITLAQAVGFDVTWDGDPQQLCFKTVAPNNLANCQVGISVTQTNSAINVPSAVETLNAANGLTPGRTQNGWGPGVTSTTLRQYPAGSSDPTQMLQTRYNMNNLTGDLWQYKMLADYSLELTPSSKASLFTGTRTLYTSKLDASGGLVSTNLVYANLSTAQQTELNKTAGGIVDALGTNRVSYLAGTDGSFRTRSSVLGTAIDSSPTVLDKVALAGYNDALFPGYPAYRKALSRPDRLAFYQSNDGFLHAYKVKDGTALLQAFSFIPGMLLKRVQDFTDSTTAQLRSNPYWLDNTPMVAEVNLGNGTVTDKDKWTSVVVANQGRGGRGVYAIDVKSGGLDKVLFEYDNTSHADLKDLGYVMGQPPSDIVTGADQIARMSNGRFAYIMGNGVDSNKGPVSSANGLGQAFLYVFYLDGGTGGVKWHKIPVPDTSVGNGLGTPRPIYDQDTGKVSLIYAGDMKGNMWRFDVTDITNMTGKVTKLFKASAGQAIYTAPIVTKSGAGDCAANDFKKCWMVTFGTGDPLNVLTTSNNTSTQSIYGVYDKGDTSTIYTPANLVSQTLGANETIAGSIQRKVSATTIAYTSTIRGWKIPLSAAEHVSANPAILPSKNIMIASTRPAGASASSCGPSASWLTTINPNSGSGSSVEVKGPVISEPQPLCRGDKLRCDDIKIPLPGLSSSLPVGVETCLPTGLTTSGAKCLFEADGSLKTPNASMVGRLSWREVFGLPK